MTWHPSSRPRAGSGVDEIDGGDRRALLGLVVHGRHLDQSGPSSARSGFFFRSPDFRAECRRRSRSRYSETRWSRPCSMASPMHPHVVSGIGGPVEFRALVATAGKRPPPFRTPTASTTRFAISSSNRGSRLRRCRERDSHKRYSPITITGSSWRLRASSGSSAASPSRMPTLRSCEDHSQSFGCHAP